MTMTRVQRMLDVLGLWRFRFYRRWVGGRWAERYVDEWTPHSTAWPYWRWVPDPSATFDDATHAIEQWSTKLPEAKGRYRE